MSKLFDFREWLTLPDAARHLCGVFGEEVSEADVLRLTLDGRLRLSIRFVNDVPAVSGTLGSQPLYSEDLAMLTRALSEKTGEPLNRREFYSTSTYIEMGRHGGKYFNSGARTSLRDVWDLPLIGDEKWEIEHRYQVLTGGPAIDGVGHEYGAFVGSLDGPLYRLIEKDGIPLFGLPEDGVLVVRSQALREFEQALNGTTTPPGDASSDRAHVSDKLANMNQAAHKFWANADRNDRATHPDNATVAAWLVARGFSGTLADKAATIIRPEWAPAGRKPEE